MCAAISTELFLRLFGGSSHTRVFLNWEAVKEADWPILLQLATQPDELSSCFLPWYLSEDKSEVDFSHPAASPISLGQIDEALPFLNHSRQTVIRTFEQRFQNLGTTVHLFVPTYGLGEGRSLVLDGCHRLMALLDGAIPFCVLLFNLLGPIDEQILPDLQHWQTR